MLRIKVQKGIFISMSHPCFETTPTLHHVHDVVQEREGNEMVVDAQTPALLLPLHRLAADDEDQGGGGEQEGLLVSGEGEHQHHRHHQQGASSESSTSSVSLSTAVIILPERMNLNNSFDPLLTPGGCDEKLDQQKTVDDRPRWKGKMDF